VLVDKDRPLHTRPARGFVPGTENETMPSNTEIIEATRKGKATRYVVEVSGLDAVIPGDPGREQYAVIVTDPTDYESATASARAIRPCQYGMMPRTQARAAARRAALKQHRS
jgi:hypothetical protein